MSALYTLPAGSLTTIVTSAAMPRWAKTASRFESIRNESSRPLVTVLPVTSLLDCTSQTRIARDGSLTLIASARLLFRLYQAPSRVPATTLKLAALETIRVSSGELVATSEPAWNQPSVVPSAMPIGVRSSPYSPMKTVLPAAGICLGLPDGTPVGATVTLPVGTIVGTTVTLPVSVGSGPVGITPVTVGVGRPVSLPVGTTVVMTVVGTTVGAVVTAPPGPTAKVPGVAMAEAVSSPKGLSEGSSAPDASCERTWSTLIVIGEEPAVRALKL